MEDKRSNYFKKKLYDCHRNIRGQSEKKFKNQKGNIKLVILPPPNIEQEYLLQETNQQHIIWLWSTECQHVPLLHEDLR